MKSGMIARIFLKFSLGILGKLPLRVHYKLAGVVTWFLAKVLHYRENIALFNITKALPHLSLYEVNAVYQKFLRHLADIIVETIWFGGCHKPQRVRKAEIVKIENPEEINRLWELAPSVMNLFSHTGNWELYGGVDSYNYTDTPMAMTENEFCFVYRKLSSPAWNAIMADNRLAPLKNRKHYDGLVESYEIMRYILSHIRKEKKIYNIAVDQRPYFENIATARIPFFFEDIDAMTGSIAVAHKLGMAVTYSQMKIVSRGHYSWKFITICDDASKMSVEDITRKYFELIEESVREQPENFMWSHRRWWDRKNPFPNGISL